MADLQEVVDYLDRLLSPKEYADSALNGLQVEAPGKPVSKIAAAVDCGLSVIEKAVESGAGLLIVHHGLLWGQCQAINGAFSRKLKALLTGGCSLYASHLPLDAHLEFGNAALLARFLDMEQTAPFCEYRGKPVGVKARFKQPASLDAILKRCAAIEGAVSAPAVLPFGKKEILTAGIVTGSGAFALEPTAREGLDLLISGEPKHEAYHTAKELGVNAIFVGHYASETFGVRAVAELVAREFGLNSTFIHEGSGI